MILHFSHIGLTDGRTFTLASLSEKVGRGPMVRGARRGSGDRCGRRYHAEAARGDGSGAGRAEPLAGAATDGSSTPDPGRTWTVPLKADRAPHAGLDSAPGNRVGSGRGRIFSSEVQDCVDERSIDRADRR